jgi:predicted aconitase with swiveling domain
VNVGRALAIKFACVHENVSKNLSILRKTPHSPSAILNSAASEAVTVSTLTGPRIFPVARAKKSAFEKLAARETSVVGAL